ncbi:hypothetical protein [Treponema zioleckii]|uniref:hypothetical protein n=1 Tax=Treponema zioleckii TaxID=331680 RepID=UPI00168ABADD|nr:hypothetical protein [Treponema zioleckii]
MKELLRKLGATITLCIYITAMAPAQVLTDKMGAGKARLDHYIDRAEKEKDGRAWEELVAEGVLEAVRAWERENAYLKENAPEMYEKERESALTYYETLKTKRYVEWAIERYSAERESRALSGLKAELREAARDFGTAGYDLQEASRIEGDWAKRAEAIINDYIGEQETENFLSMPEITARLEDTGLDDGWMRSFAEETRNLTDERIRAESRMLSKKEGSRLVVNFLRDKDSLRASGTEKAAATIARDISERTSRENSESMESVFAELKKNIEGRTDGDVPAGELLKKFEDSFGRGIAKWEDAELEFLSDRAEWEKNAGEAFAEGHESWEKAFEELRSKRQEWETEISDKIAELSRLAAEKNSEFEKEIKSSLDAYAAELKTNSEVQQQIFSTYKNIYDTLRTALATSKKGIESIVATWGSKYNGVYSYWKTEDTDSEDSYLCHLVSGTATVNVATAEDDKRKIKDSIKAYLIKERDMLIREYEAAVAEAKDQAGEKEKKLNARLEEYENTAELSGISGYHHINPNMDENQLIRILGSRYVPRNILSAYREYKESLSKCEALAKYSDMGETLADYTERAIALVDNDGDKAEAEKVHSGIEQLVSSIKTETILSGNGNFVYEKEPKIAFYTLVDWYTQTINYARELDETQNSLMKFMGGIQDSGTPTELDLEITRAECLKMRASEEYEIAKAVNLYAERADASRESKDETNARLAESVLAYENAFAAYEETASKLTSYSNEIEKAKSEISLAERKLSSRQAELERLKTEYESMEAADDSSDTKIIGSMLKSYLGRFESLVKQQQEAESGLSYSESKNEEAGEYTLIKDAEEREAESVRSRISAAQSVASKLSGVEDGRFTEMLASELQDILSDELLKKQYEAAIELGAKIDSLKNDSACSPEYRQFYREIYISEIKSILEYATCLYRERLNGLLDSAETNALPETQMSYMEKVRAVLLIAPEKNKALLDEIDSYLCVDAESERKSLLKKWADEGNTGILSIMNEAYEFENAEQQKAFGYLEGLCARNTALQNEFDEKRKIFFDRGAEHNAGKIIAGYNTAKEKIRKLIEENNNSRKSSRHGYEDVIDYISSLYADGKNLSRTGLRALEKYIDAYLWAEAVRYVHSGTDEDETKKRYDQILSELTAGENADGEMSVSDKKYIESRFLEYALQELSANRTVWAQKLTECRFVESGVYAGETEMANARELLKNVDSQLFSLDANSVRECAKFFSGADSAVLYDNDGKKKESFLKAEDDLLSLIKTLNAYATMFVARQEGDSGKGKIAKQAEIEKAAKELAAARKEYDAGLDKLAAAGENYNHHVESINRQYGELESLRLSKRIAQAVHDFATSVYFEDIGKNSDEEYVTPKEALSKASYALRKAENAVETLKKLRNEYETAGAFAEKKETDEYITAEKEYYHSLVLEHEMYKILNGARENLNVAESEVLADYEKISGGSEYERNPDERNSEKISDGLRYDENSAASRLVEISVEEGVPRYRLNYWVEKIPVYRDETQEVTESYEYIDDDGDTCTGQRTVEKTVSVFDHYDYKLKEYDTDRRNDGETEKNWYENLSLSTKNVTLPEVKRSVGTEEIHKFILRIGENPEYLKKVTLAAYYLLAKSAEAKTIDNKDGKCFKDPYSRAWTAGGGRDGHSIDFVGYYRTYRDEALREAYESVMAGGTGMEDTALYLLARQGKNIIAGMVRAGYEENLLKSVACGKLARKMERIEDNETWFKPFFGGYTTARGKFARELKRDASSERSYSSGEAQKSLSGLETAIRNYKDAVSKKDSALSVYNNILYGSATAPDKDIDGKSARDSIVRTMKEKGSALLENELSVVLGRIDGTKKFKDVFVALDEMKKNTALSMSEAKVALSKKAVADHSLLEDNAMAFRTLAEKTLTIDDESRSLLRKYAMLAGDTTLSLAERASASAEYDRIYSGILSTADEDSNVLFDAAKKAFSGESYNSQKLYGALEANYAGYFAAGSSAAKTDRNSESEGYISELFGIYGNFLAEELSDRDTRKYVAYEMSLRNSQLLLRKETSDSLSALADLARISGGEWDRAEERLRAQQNAWQRNFLKRYGKENGEWQDSYEEFLREKQEWVTGMYMAAASDTAVPDGASEAESAIARVSARKESGKSSLKADFDISEILGSLLGGTRLTELAADFDSAGKLIGSLRGAVGARAIGGSCEKELYAARDAMNGVTARMEETASRLAALTAVENLERRRAEAGESVDGANEYVESSIRAIAESDGYAVKDGSISRKAVVDSTFWKTIYETQTVRGYERFRTAAPVFSLSLGSMLGMTARSLTAALALADEELRLWRERIFGDGDGIIYATSGTDGKTRDTGLGFTFGGEFGEHLGERGELVENPDTSRSKESNVKRAGKGAIAQTMLDFDWNNARRESGWAELSKPSWDKKLWSGTGPFGFEPPSVRTVATVAAAVAASVATAGAASGVAGVLASAAISSGITMGNELAFATLDLVGGYKTAYDIGKSLAVSAATNILGGASGVAGHAAKGIAGVGGVALRTGISSASSVLTKATGSFISSGGDWKAVKSDLNSFSDWGGIIASTAGAAVTNSLGEMSLGTGNIKVTGFNSAQIGEISSLNGLLGGIASSAVSYGLTGSATLNVARLGGSGVLELTLGKDGVSSRLGTGGTDVSLGTLRASVAGAGNLRENWQINSVADSQSVASAMRSLYGFGDTAQKQLLDDLTSKKAVLHTGGTDGTAETRLSGGVRHVYLSSETASDWAKAGIALGHEAYRNGVYDGEAGQLAETVSAVLGHSEFVRRLSQDIAYKNITENILSSNEQLRKDVLFYEHYMDALRSGDNSSVLQSVGEIACNVIKNYEISGDYWYLKKNGQLIDDYCYDRISYEDNRETRYFTTVKKDLMDSELAFARMFPDIFSELPESSAFSKGNIDSYISNAQNFLNGIETAIDGLKNTGLDKLLNFNETNKVISHIETEKNKLSTTKDFMESLYNKYKKDFEETNINPLSIETMEYAKINYLSTYLEQLMKSHKSFLNTRLLIMNKEVCSIKDCVAGLRNVAKDIEKDRFDFVDLSLVEGFRKDFNIKNGSYILSVNTGNYFFTPARVRFFDFVSGRGIESKYTPNSQKIDFNFFTENFSFNYGYSFAENKHSISYKQKF